MGKIAITPGMTVVFHGDDEDSYISDGMTATVVSEPDEAGWFQVEGADTDGDKGTWDVDADTMEVDGTGDVTVSVVTISSVGNTTPLLSVGQRVRVHTLTVADNNGTSINGVEGTVYDWLDGKGTAPSGTYWWVEFPVSNFEVDGFYTDYYGRALQWSDTYALDKNAPSPFTNPEAGSAFAKIMDKPAKGVTHDDLMEMMEKVEQASAFDGAPVNAPTIANVRTEYGHISPDGTVWPWDKAFGEFPNKPIKINDEMCEPVQRDVVTTEWVK